MEFNIEYRACIGSLIWLLSKRADLSFVGNKLAIFSSNPCKVHLEWLVHLLRYIRDNKTLGLNYYADVKDSPISDLLRKDSIKTDNKLMNFSDSSWQDCPDTGRSIVSYIIFYQGGPIYHGTNVPGPVSQSMTEIEYNTSCTAGTALVHFRMFIYELLKKYPDIVPEEAPLIILDSKYAVCMYKNGKDTKGTSHISRRVDLIRNGEKCKLHRIAWCKGGLQLGDIATKNLGDNNLNLRIKYIIVSLDNW